MSFEIKYLKYKMKYLTLKNQAAGSNPIAKTCYFHEGEQKCLPRRGVVNVQCDTPSVQKGLCRQTGTKGIYEGKGLRADFVDLSGIDYYEN
jgi:hypothetical protein